MSELIIRQGTIYRHRTNGEQQILIHHNPMQLQSLRLRQPAAGENRFAAPELIGVEEIIAMRHSGEYEELGDLPRPALRELLNALIAAQVLPEPENRLLAAIRDEA